MVTAENIGRIEACQSEEELISVFQKLIEEKDFASFCVLETSEASSGTYPYVGTVELSWVRDYLSYDFGSVDEALKLARRTNVPFAWGEVPMPKRGGRRKPGALKVFEAAKDHKFNEGLVIPFTYSDHLPRPRSALCCLYWKDHERWFKRHGIDLRLELHTLLLYWAERRNAIYRANVNFRSNVVGIRATRAESMRAYRLSDREREMLKMAGRGKTIAQTAQELCLAKGTVDTTLKNAIRKLGAGNKTHAVAMAVTEGLIDL